MESSSAQVVINKGLECAISVVIPCFNHGEFLPEAVASVQNAKRDDVELIVVDDGSTDERTRKEMDALAGRGIRVLRQDNKGLAAARNAGIAASTGEYILPLDADNRVRLRFFERGKRILGSDRKVGVVYGDAQFIGERTGRWQVGPFDSGQLMRWNYIDACAIYRRKVWEQIGGYDGTMPVQGFEDWDFWLGALEYGWEFAYVPEILFDYRVAKESMITHARRFEAEIRKFATHKHGELYRRGWEQLEFEHRSVRATARNLRRLIKLRLKRKLGINDRDGRNGNSDR
jgi:glycosyltransferase involved in cell wall biosynthesis